MYIHISYSHHIISYEIMFKVATKGKFRNVVRQLFCSKYDPTTKRQVCGTMLRNPQTHVFQIDPLPWTLNFQSEYIPLYRSPFKCTIPFCHSTFTNHPSIFKLALYHEPLPYGHLSY